MKKIFSLIFALMMVFTMANAQTVVRDGVFSNMYVGINGGAIHNPVSNYDNFDFKALNYNGALEIGKNVTPITGFSLVGEMFPKFEDGFGVKATTLSGNVKFNLMNLFGRYKGYPRRFEIQTVTGIGWDHYFNASNPNDMSLNAGLEFDFNLGKQRAWYITFTPQVVAHEILKYNDIQPMVKNADLQANIGIAYRFGSKKTGSHNFVICPYTYTDEQYAKLYAMYDECMNRPATVDTVVVEKIVKVEVVKNDTSSNYQTETYVYFEKGSSELGAKSVKVIEHFVKNLPSKTPVKVIGSADTKTGSMNFNQDLSEDRANKVVALLKKLGVENIEVESTVDLEDTPELSRCALIMVVE